MKISFSWLKEYIKTDLDIKEVSEILTDTGLEVEGTEEVESIKGGLKGVVIGEVMECVQHPDADRLKLTKVNIGQEELLQIVCGAPNVAAGQKVLVATIGTVIYTEEGSFTIKKGKLRGQASEGMICAEDELGLGNSHDGIMILPQDAPIGTPAAKYFKIENDQVIEIGLTPNRTDALGHFGVARDLKAALLHKGIQASADLPRVSDIKPQSNDLKINIEIKDEDACARYMGLSIQNVQVQDSPEWLQNKLKAIGLKPKNNIVDISNYVLHETGHPMHVFDADQLSGNTIIIQKNQGGRKITTLDEKERELHNEDLIICDSEKPLVIAGVMGGVDSSVTNSTKNIFIELAWFDPVSVRKTAKRHAINSDSSFRYERGVDPEMTSYAMKRAVDLILEHAGGKVSMDLLDVHPRTIAASTFDVNIDRINRLIGQEIDSQTIENILVSLDIKIKSKSDKDWTLEVPAYRADVTREADIVEEILRIFGFNAIRIDHKMSISVANRTKTANDLKETISQSLSGRGFLEIMNNSLTKATYFDGNGFKAEESVEMLNPLSQDLKVLRQHLVFGALENLAHNINRKKNNLKFYEFGSTYSIVDEKYKEQQNLVLLATGSEESENWMNAKAASNFYHIRSEAQQILEELGLDTFQEENSKSELFDYGLSFNQGPQVLVEMGKLNSSIAKEIGLKQEVFFANFNWTLVSKRALKVKRQFVDLPKYPSVRRDFALLVNKEVEYAALKRAALKAEKKLLKEVNLFDVYEGKNLAENKKSYAMSFILSDVNKTLNDKDVDKAMARIFQSLESEFKAELRA